MHKFSYLLYKHTRLLINIILIRYIIGHICVISDIIHLLYNIKLEKISGDNVYQFLLFFDNLYDRFTDMEKKIFMKSFLEEGNIYEAEQEDGRILRSLKFRFPVFFNEHELYELDWDNESTVESVLLMRRAKR